MTIFYLNTKGQLTELNQLALAAMVTTSSWQEKFVQVIYHSCLDGAEQKIAASRLLIFGHTCDTTSLIEFVVLEIFTIM